MNFKSTLIKIKNRLKEWFCAAGRAIAEFFKGLPDKLKSLNVPGVAIYILAGSLVFCIAAFIMYEMTFDAFHYENDKWIEALFVMTFWSYACIIIGTLISGNGAKATDALYIVAAFALTIATIKFLIPCLSPIGIYFTVHNMGDVEANAIGVPRSIVTIVLFVVSILLLVVSAFFPSALGKRRVK